MTEQTKNKLASVNDLGNDRYEDKIKEEIRKEVTISEELAILRKAIALIFEIISTIHTEEISNAEFEKHNTRIEEIKKKYEVLKS